MRNPETALPNGNSCRPYEMLDVSCSFDVTVGPCRQAERAKAGRQPVLFFDQRPQP